MKLQDVRDKYQQASNQASQLVHTSPFQQKIIIAGDELFIRCTAISNALYAFRRYSSKRGVAKWLQGQIDTYKDAAKGNEEVTRRNLLSAEVVQEMLNDVLAI